MNSVNALYHLARADFLERTRRYSFLVMLGAIIWLGYAATTGILVLLVFPNYVGETNSPWVGALMTMTATLFLGWFGFYLVKGSVGRDYETGVGQIMATTPLSRPLYMLGKWLSNFAVLSVMILILMVAGILMNLLVGTSPVDVLALVMPLLLIALPSMAIVAAAAVLFEVIGWLRGGLGNVIYFFMFMLVMIPSTATDIYQPLLDFHGYRLISDGIASAAKVTYPDADYGVSFTVNPSLTESMTESFDNMGSTSGPQSYTASRTSGSQYSVPSHTSDLQTFVYKGIEWNAGIIGSRFFFLLFAFGMTMLAAALFDRFDSSKVLNIKKKGDKPRSVNDTVVESSPAAQAHLSPLTDVRSRFRFGALYIAELKMLLKGHRWWWYLVTLGLIIAQFVPWGEINPMVPGGEITRMLLTVAWAWPILLLSGLGSREARHNTHQIVFTAPRPVLNQLPALWLAAFTVIALMGSGACLRFLLDGQMTSLLAWLGGALFIPSLALAMGVLTRSGKLFEVVYALWMYIVLQKVSPLDFVGVTPTSPWYVYALLAVGLVVLTAFVRQRQLISNRILM